MLNEFKDFLGRVGMDCETANLSHSGSGSKMKFDDPIIEQHYQAFRFTFTVGFNLGRKYMYNEMVKKC